MSENLSAQKETMHNTNGPAEETGLNELVNEFTGEVILPLDTKYSELSEKIVKKGNPAIVLRPLNTEDVSKAINYARSNDMLLSIHSGGHGLPGYCTNDGGVVIDMSAINNVTIKDRSKNIVRIGTGAKWGEVALILQPYNLAISSGDTKSVGVGGLTLGGGIGWLVRKHGLTIDSIVGAEVVTADGEILYVNENEHPDLFWGLRGGGCSFCVVVHYDIIAQPLEKIVGGTIQYSLDNLSQLLKQWRDHMRVAPDELTSTIRIMPPMFGNPAAVILQFVYAGAGEEAIKSAEPFLKIDNVVSSDVKEMFYADFLEEPMAPPPTIKIIFNNIYTEDFSDEVIEKITEASGTPASPVFQIRSLGGIMYRISDTATAYTNRNAEVLIASASFFPVEATEDETNKALVSWNNIAEYGSGSFVSFFAGSDLREIFPGSTYLRLAEIKRTYDPDNVFNRNFDFN